ncbi:MAG: carboxymuconolactone decarboxylase family protein [Acidimicrobiia bacterium]
MSRGATEDLVAKLAAFEQSDLPERTKAALRLVEALGGPAPAIDRNLYEEAKKQLSDEEILDLGMCATFVDGWQRFIEAFGIVPDAWRDGSPPPWEALGEGADPGAPPV